MLGNISVGIIGVPPEIRTEYLSNECPKRRCFSQLSPYKKRKKQRDRKEGAGRKKHVRKRTKVMKCSVKVL